MVFPFMFELSGKLIVIVGGGTVALRKCRLFLEFGADVSVVAPGFCEEFFKLDGILHMIRDIYRPEYLEGAFAVVAACNDSAVNSAVWSQCKEQRIPVNVVDQPALCSFYVPATVRRGNLTIGISTNGKSPAMAGIIRQELEDAYGDEYAFRLQLLGELRELAQASIYDPEIRRALLIEAASLTPSAVQDRIQQIRTGAGDVGVLQPIEKGESDL